MKFEAGTKFKYVTILRWQRAPNLTARVMHDLKDYTKSSKLANYIHKSYRRLFPWHLYHITYYGCNLQFP